VKGVLDRRKDASILVLDGATSGTIEIDFRGTIEDVLARLPEAGNAHSRREPAGGGFSAKPAVPAVRSWAWVAREITLLPRHWDWLARQRGGASVAIRQLVEEARRTGEDRDRVRQAQESAYRFMSVTAGNRPHYEDAIRALFSGETTRFEKLIAEWPKDVRDHAIRLAEKAFHREPQAPRR